MPWPLVLMDKDAATAADRPIGACWYIDIHALTGREDPAWEDRLSQDYWHFHAGHRLPLVVQTPVGPWCVDAKTSDGRSGWVVTGDPPLITVTPSINYGCSGPGNGYHGWIVNGELSSDIEGRTY